MSEKVIFELCAETLQACIAARDGGADRIELCSALSEDGLTPSHGLIHAAVERTGLPIHVIIRPRGGDFLYTDDEFAMMRDDVKHASEMGAAGVVIGLLHKDRTVDIDRTRELVELAGVLEVTFHRAFDLTPSRETALEEVIATGCRRLLTSGGEPDAVAGTANLAVLVKQAAGRIAIAAGGGLRHGNVAKVVDASGVRQVHSSLRRKVQAETNAVLSSVAIAYIVDPADIRQFVDAINDR
jgi:copper homeostasis protein